MRVHSSSTAVSPLGDSGNPEHPVRAVSPNGNTATPNPVRAVSPNGDTATSTLMCIVLKKVYTYWLIILIQVYKLKIILNTVYTFLFLHGWLKRKQALLRSILPGITPVCNEVYRLRARFYPGSFFIYFGTPNALKKPKPANVLPPFYFY